MSPLYARASGSGSPVMPENKKHSLTITVSSFAFPYASGQRGQDNSPGYKGERSLICDDLPGGLQEVMVRFVCVHSPQQSRFSRNTNMQGRAAARSLVGAQPFFTS